MASDDGPGRPKIELTDEQVDLIEKLASYGLTQAQIAECLPFSERTLRNRLRSGDHAEIVAAYRRGRAKDARQLSERHRQLAMGEVDGVKKSDQRKAIQWRLERQHGWSETKVHEHSGPGGGPIPTEINVQLVEPDDDDDADGG